jgi:DHA1 family bicyclomycin/chloramphenicol resistance-like MFS transporter
MRKYRSFAMAGLFAYIGSSSFVFVDHFGLPPAIYSLVLAGIALGMVVGGQINVLLLSRRTEHQILVFGLLLHAACCVALLVATLAMGPESTWPAPWFSSPWRA